MSSKFNLNTNSFTAAKLRFGLAGYDLNRSVEMMMSMMMPYFYGSKYLMRF